MSRGPRRPRRRGIAPEDRALWNKVIRDATPLESAPGDPARTDRPAGPRPPPRPATPPATVPAKPPAALPATPRRLRPAGSAKPPPPGIGPADRGIAPVGRLEAGLDRRNSERLRRGGRAPDGRIDLHGMTAERAHRALDRYIGGALARGERLILVITGKGGKRRNMDDAPFMRDGEGVLRQQAPRWLHGGPHANRIVGIYQAHPRHGGAGAFYVYLKKRRFRQGR